MRVVELNIQLIEIANLQKKLKSRKGQTEFTAEHTLCYFENVSEIRDPNRNVSLK